MTLTLPEAKISAPASTLDSLKHSISKLEHTVDSLHKVVFKTEIAGDYFYQIMLLQLTIFVAIIGIGGWIGWGFFVKILDSHKENLENSTSQALAEITNEMSKSFDEFNTTQNKIEFNVNRSLTNTTSRSKDFDNAFGWSILTIISAFKAKKSNELILSVFKASSKYLSKISDGNAKLKKNIELFIPALDIGDQSDSEEIRKISGEIREVLYHKAHTMTPLNLFEGPSNEPIPATESPTTT